VKGVNQNVGEGRNAK